MSQCPSTNCTNLAKQTVGDINTHQILIQVALGVEEIFLYDTEGNNLYNQNGYILTEED